MAAAHRTATDALASPAAAAIPSRLAGNATQYDYFQALRLLECAHRGWPRLGTAPDPHDEFVRLEHEPTMAFTPSSTAAFETGDTDRPARLASHCLGLVGPNGPLPLHLTEYAVERSHHFGDETFSRFLDLFHHRMLSLFYRAWADAQPTVQSDRPESDRFGVYLGSLIGIGFESQRDRDALPDATKLHFAGRFVAGPRNAEGLEAILNDVLGVSAEVVPFAGAWLTIPEECRVHLGRSPGLGRLGESATIGTRVWDRQSQCRVVLGPMRLDRFEGLLPGGKQDRLLADTLRQYLCDEIACDVVLELDGRDIPPLQLGHGARLGRTTWIPGRKPFPNRRDVVLKDELRTRGTG